jgi:hypothetical protein
MLTQKQIEGQELFERKQIRGGVDKLNFKTNNLKDNIYPSETVYDSSFINRII